MPCVHEDPDIDYQRTLLGRARLWGPRSLWCCATPPPKSWINNPVRLRRLGLYRQEADKDQSTVDASRGSAHDVDRANNVPPSSSSSSSSVADAAAASTIV